MRRAALIEGESQRTVAREFGLARKTVRKMLAYSEPPGYQRQQPVQRPRLGPWPGVIDAILKNDKTRPAKQRYTAKRIFERLKEEYGFSGGYTIVKDYVRGEELRGREMFVPLVHPPGEALADFGEALLVIAGMEQKAHFLAMDCPHSDDGFVAAFPGETTEAFQQGHVLAFEYFGAVPTRILYDFVPGNKTVAQSLEDTAKIGERMLAGFEQRLLRGVRVGSMEGIAWWHPHRAGDGFQSTPPAWGAMTYGAAFACNLLCAVREEHRAIDAMPIPVLRAGELTELSFGDLRTNQQWTP